MNQRSFCDIEYENREMKTTMEFFLAAMNKIIPWRAWVAMIAPYYPSGHKGRPPKEIETMLRMYLLQNWYHMSDKGIEEAVYNFIPFRLFMHLGLLEERVPDATTLLHFRHLLEKHNIGEKIFEDVKARLDTAGLLMRGGSVVDSTLIEAPSSTKNKEGKRDPEMHQAKKGNQWHFGMKVHAGVDAGSGYVHTITGTPANTHDVVEAPKLIREDDEVVYGDAGYTGIEKREEVQEDEHLSKVDYRITRKPTGRSKAPKNEYWAKLIEKRKSSVRSKVEHPFLIVKRQFGYGKVSYRGIAKNMNRFFVLFASANLVMCLRAGRQKDFCAI